MVHTARCLPQDQEGTFHVFAHVAGPEGYNPLKDDAAARQLLDTVIFFAAAYCCRIYSVAIMGNHWHGVIRFEAPRPMERAELRQRADLLYPGALMQERLDCWDEECWEHFRKRLFSLSEFMRNVQGAFAQWYNNASPRKGRFWADRYGSNQLLDELSMLFVMAYVDLNSVRSGLCDRPQDHPYSSLYLREAGLDGWLEPLETLLGGSREGALRQYKSMVYYLGNIPREGKGRISDELLHEAEKRGFAREGAFRKRIGYFSTGLAMGPREAVREVLNYRRSKGVYKRRKNPLSVQEESELCVARRERLTKPKRVTLPV